MPASLPDPRYKTDRFLRRPGNVAQRLRNSLWGLFVGDALAMPVHGYFDRGALRQDYGVVTDYQAPRNPHPDSILWRLTPEPPQPGCDILHDQRQFWGQRDVHYHQFLAAGENTLNLKCAAELLDLVALSGQYDADRYLERYVAFLRKPNSHNDTYVDESHRHFFERLARGAQPSTAGQPDSRIGGLVSVPILVALLHRDPVATRQAVQTHVGWTHRAQETLAAADAVACLLLELIAGHSLKYAAERVARSVHEARLVPARLHEWRDEPDDEVVGGRLSNASYVDEAFPATLYLALKYSDDFERALVANTNLGGDNCHRGALLGALLGAASDAEVIPSRWISGLQARPRLEFLIDSLVRLVS